MIKVMCVDDQLLLKETMIYMLKQDPDIEAIDGGNDGYEALNICESYRPHVILMDLRMPRLGGIETTTKIKALYPSIKIIILTTFEDQKSIFDSIEHGADGYIVKDIKPEELVLAVKSVYHNLYVMHKNVVNIVKEEIIDVHIKEKDQQETLKNYDLTPMEIKIIKLMVDGKSNKEIAYCLKFTEGTVKNKVSKILSKLGLKDRTQIAVFAIKHNLT